MLVPSSGCAYHSPTQPCPAATVTSAEALHPYPPARPPSGTLHCQQLPQKGLRKLCRAVGAPWEQREPPPALPLQERSQQQHPRGESTSRASPTCPVHVLSSTPDSRPPPPFVGPFQSLELGSAQEHLPVWCEEHQGTLWCRGKEQGNRSPAAQSRLWQEKCSEQEPRVTH